jgi:hypothetical protein
VWLTPVSAVTAIKTKHHVKKNWRGDPCAPKTMAWERLTCSYAIATPPRITSLWVFQIYTLHWIIIFIVEFELSHVYGCMLI